MLKLLYVLTLAVTVVFAGFSWKNIPVDGPELQKELTAAGCTVKHIETFPGGAGIIYGPECAEAAAVLAMHNSNVTKNAKAVRMDRIDALIVIAGARNLSSGEMNEAIAILLKKHKR